MDNLENTSQKIMAPMAILHFQHILRSFKCQEMDRYRKILPNREREIAESIAENMIMKIVKIPEARIMSTNRSEVADYLSKTLIELFSVP
jgi:glutamyl-tRNA reductase